jgi:predicted phage terminase large subunit-like protein
MDNVYEWYGAGFYTRRMPERNVIVVIMTRWNVGDICGRLLADAVSNPGADQWEVLKIPAIIDQATADLLNSCSDDPHIDTPHFYKPGDSFSPRRWPLEELMRTKATLTSKAWSSLYMQNPVEEEGGILQRHWWRAWPKNKPLPECSAVYQSYDTAFEEGEHNDFSVRTTWGVFTRESDNKQCVILLERMKERLSFPKLLENTLASYREYKPDRLIIEKAASGIPLIQEMRKRGVPVAPIKPIGSKIARAHAAAIVLEQGSVYYVERAWAEDLLDECAAFPNTVHDDQVDSTVNMLSYFRRVHLVDTPNDYEPDEDEYDQDSAAKRRYAVRRRK